MKSSTKLTKVFFTVLLFTCISSARAQWVTISDVTFANYLQTNFPGCMSGNQLDTTCSGIVNETYLSIISPGIPDITGIQYFDNLDSLEYSFTSATSLPPLPQGLVYLDCSYNSITSLSNLPNAITYLDCSNNLITNLSNLPTSLIELHCYYNNLDSLPSLPGTLNILLCWGNSLTSLPSLPPNLSMISAGQNSLSTLPTLPSSLTYLSVHNNFLSTLPSLPPSLEALGCADNTLTSLPPLPTTLLELFCMLNSLTSLPSLPDNLERLHCSQNLLTCLPILPDTLIDLYVGYYGITCMPNYPVVSNYDINPASLTICDLSSGCPFDYNIKGKLYSDTNLDCGYQIGENLLSLVPVKLYQGATLIAQSYNSAGYYAFNTSLGNYDVVIDTTGLPFDVACTNPGMDTTISLTALDSLSENIDFGFKCKPGYDLAIQSIYRSSGEFFPGEMVGVQCILGDVSMLYLGVACNTTGVSGVVQITVTGPVNYFSPAPGCLTPIVSGNIFTYNIADFSLINPNTDFGIFFSTDTLATIGDQVCFDVSISSSGTELTLLNNTLNHCFQVVNSYDPNIKEVSPIGNLTYPFNDWLTYTIHFQNTGSASAANIKILDILDSDLDETSFRLLSYSHPVDVSVSGNTINFKFTNINLIDSTTYEPASHGFVQYKIKPNLNLISGSEINNTANIYFDFNSPITTNTTSNLIGFVSIDNENTIHLNVYPNPASDFLILQFDQTSDNRYMQVFDMMGRLVLHQLITGANNMISLDGLLSGIYSIKIIEKSQKTFRKIIVQK